MHDLIQQLIYGLSIGATYALIALGYTMVYGVLRLINFAHGEIYMAGAVIGWYLGSAVVAGPIPVWISTAIICGLPGLITVWYLTRSATPSSIRILASICAGGLLGLGGWYLARYLMPNSTPAWAGLAIVFGGAMVGCATLGFAIEFFAYRPLRARPRLVVLITAIGVSLLLQNLAQQNAVFGPTPQRFPELIHARTVLSFPIGGRPVEISNLDLLSLILSFALMAVLTWVVLKTKVGLALRAVSFRVDTAALMGVNTDRTISWTFMLGSALAAVAGVLDAIRYDVKPLMGLMPGLKAFIAAVLGGIGSIPGALVGALLLGIVETMARFYLPRGYTEYADAVAFVVLILILLFKPSGLLGRATREKV